MMKLNKKREIFRRSVKRDKEREREIEMSLVVWMWKKLNYKRILLLLSPLLSSERKMKKSFHLQKKPEKNEKEDESKFF